MHFFRDHLSIYVCASFPFGFEGGTWDWIVLIPNCCVCFYFYSPFQGVTSVVVHQSYMLVYPCLNSLHQYGHPNNSCPLCFLFSFLVMNIENRCLLFSIRLAKWPFVCKELFIWFTVPVFINLWKSVCVLLPSLGRMWDLIV